MSKYIWKVINCLNNFFYKKWSNGVIEKLKLTRELSKLYLGLRGGVVYYRPGQRNNAIDLSLYFDRQRVSSKIAIVHADL